MRPITPIAAPNSMIANAGEPDSHSETARSAYADCESIDRSRAHGIQGRSSAREASDAWNRSPSWAWETGSSTRRGVGIGARGAAVTDDSLPEGGRSRVRCVDEHTHRWVYLSV